MKKIIIFSTIIFCMLFLFCSCGKSSITFDANGGELNVETLEFKYDKSYSLPIPQMPGYRFVGWYMGDEQIPQTGKWPFKENISVTARWEFMEYKIIYDLDGGTLENQILGFNYDTPTFSIPEPTKENYIFSHWEDPKGNQYKGAFTIPQGTDSDVYLKAVWWDFEEDGVRYIYENDSLTVYTYEGSGKQEIVIPNELYGKPIVKIREGAFRDLGRKVAGQNAIYRVYLSNSIKFVGKNAFLGCDNVKVVYNVSSNENYVAKTTEWLEGVTIEKTGNEYFVDVILRKRATFNSSLYVQIYE